MMHATAGVQANFDFDCEADAATKLRLALAASPISSALFANSSISQGRPNGFESWRAWIWRHTDNDRWSLLPFAFERSFGAGTAYRAYTEWALDVPMFLIVRDGRSIPAHGQTFRDFLANGRDEMRASLADWNVHLTTLFPEVRLKRVIETRGTDAVPGAAVCALPAFWKGLLYDETALEAGLARDRLLEPRTGLRPARRGRARRTPGADPRRHGARGRARAASRSRGRACVRQAVLDAAGRDEAIHLEPLEAVVERGSSPARAVLESWNGPWQKAIPKLIEYAKY